MCRRSDTLKRKTAVSNGKAVAELVFVEKGVSWGIVIFLTVSALALIFAASLLTALLVRI